MQFKVLCSLSSDLKWNARESIIPYLLEMPKHVFRFNALYYISGRQMNIELDRKFLIFCFILKFIFTHACLSYKGEKKSHKKLKFTLRQHNHIPWQSAWMVYIILTFENTNTYASFFSFLIFVQQLYHTKTWPNLENFKVTLSRKSREQKLVDLLHHFIYICMKVRIMQQ